MGTSLHGRLAMSLHHPDPRVAYLMGRSDAQREIANILIGNSALATELFARSRATRARAVEAASSSYAVGSPTCPGCGSVTEEHEGHYICTKEACKQYGSSLGEVEDPMAEHAEDVRMESEGMDRYGSMG